LAKNAATPGFTVVAPAMKVNIQNRLRTASFFAAVAAAYVVYQVLR
jgi:hypothetical protein